VVLASGHRRVNLDDCLGLYLGIQPVDLGRGEATNDGKAIACYSRVSTASQKEDLERQRLELDAYAKSNYPGRTVRTYSEIGSGANADRVQLNKLIDDCLASKVETVIISVRERISRTSFRLIELLLQRCNVNIVQIHPESDPLDAEAELMADLTALTTLYVCRKQARRHARNVMFVCPERLKERVSGLYSQGLSYRQICPVVMKEGFRCANTGKDITEWMVYRVFKEVRQTLRAVKNAQCEIIPEHVKAFVKQNCSVGSGKKVYAKPLYTLYTLFCKRERITALDQQQFSKGIKSMSFRYQRESCKRFRVYGLEIRGNEYASRSFKAEVSLV